MGVDAMTRMNKSLVVFAMMIALVAAGPAVAETLSGQLVVNVPDAKVIEAGDAEGHVVLLAQLQGLVIFDDGEVATLTGLEVADDTASQHVFFGYKVLTFEDGSTMSARFEGTQSADAEMYEGTFVYTGGTGRFAGIKGGGALKGKNYDAISGSRAEFEAEYSVPPK